MLSQITGTHLDTHILPGQTAFESGLPHPPLFSPLAISLPHMAELAQWNWKHLDHTHPNSSASKDSQMISPPNITPPSILRKASAKNVTEIPNQKHAVEAIRKASAVEQGHTTPLTRQQLHKSPPLLDRDNEPEITSLISDAKYAEKDLPPLQHVGAFHAGACIVEAQAPAMQRGFSHHAEIMSTTDFEHNKALANPAPNLAIDLDFPSFSSLFPSQNQSDVLSPSWQLELTHSPSWHIAAESAAALSLPESVAHGANLVRRPATRRRSVADPSVSIRNSPQLNGSRSSVDASPHRHSMDAGILRGATTSDSPVIKSQGLRVRFE